MTAMSTIITRLSVEGRSKLALRFPTGATKGAGPSMSAALGEDGFFVSGGGAAPWRFESIVQDEDGALLIGPDAIGQAVEGGTVAPPSSLDDSAGLEEGLSRLLALARAFALLEADGKLPRGLVSSGILFGSGDAASADMPILMLPPVAAGKALVAGGAQTRTAAVARLVSQKSRGAGADASFLLAQAAYRFATGKHAFEREAGEVSSMAGSSPSSAPLSLAAPRLDPGLAALVDKALADPEASPLGEWRKVLGAARDAGWKRELAPELEAELARRSRAMEARERSRRSLADFLRRRGGILIAAAVAIVIAAFIFGEIARAQSEKPNYSALTPRELVARYYQAIDKIDLDSLEACGEKKAFKADDDMILNLVVITRTRLAYEGKSPLVRAADWVAAGEPPLPPTAFLFGIVGLSIAEEASAANAVAFRATYSLWTLERSDSASPDAAAVPTESRRSDLLTLAPAKKGWRIVDLERSVLP